ncbi:MAG: SCP2 sterol-binding domain-containing protein [Chromatiales bacterium]|nr:SCP2 sterol-binding domain-containing protein [Chromatiales bacterium]
MEVAAAFNALLETAFNRYLTLDPDAPVRLAALEGKVVCVQVEGLGLEFYLLPGVEGVHILNRYEGEADVTLSGPPLALARLGLSGDAEDRLFSHEVVMQGDADTGQRFQAIFAELDIDWEEQLSHLVGDLAAHQLGRLAYTGAQWARQSVGTLERNLGEYLQHEHRDLPPRAELEDFYDRVDTLRCDTDRLQARLNRIDAALASPSKKKAAAKKTSPRKKTAKKRVAKKKTTKSSR